MNGIQVYKHNSKIIVMKDNTDSSQWMLHPAALVGREGTHHSSPQELKSKEKEFMFMSAKGKAKRDL